MPKNFIMGVTTVAVGVIVAGLIMWGGRDLPLIGDARNGFDV